MLYPLSYEGESTTVARPRFAFWLGWGGRYSTEMSAACAVVVDANYERTAWAGRFDRHGVSAVRIP